MLVKEILQKLELGNSVAEYDAALELVEAFNPSGNPVFQRLTETEPLEPQRPPCPA